LYSTAPGSYINNSISGNTIDTLSSESSGYSTVVIGIGSQAPHNLFFDIDSNIVHTLRNAAANTNAISAAAIQGISTNPPYPAPVTITRNRIYDLESTTTAASTVVGINSAHMGADEIEVLIPALARSLQALGHPAITDNDEDKAPFLLTPIPRPMY